MADNKKRNGLGQPARNTLTALDRALLDLSIDTQERQPDEFSIKDLLEAAGNNFKITAIRMRAYKLVKEGKWSVRSIRGVMYYKAI